MSTKLTAEWQLNAALLSRPINLQTVVAMSAEKAASFDEKIVNRLVRLLNDNNTNKIDKNGKEDILKILGNIAKIPERRDDLQEHVSGVNIRPSTVLLNILTRKSHRYCKCRNGSKVTSPRRRAAGIFRQRSA
jgi:hypothetical protein